MNPTSDAQGLGKNIILASSSKYRKELLTRLQLPFSSQSPDVDETPKPGESPRKLAARLARTKAVTVALAVLENLGKGNLAQSGSFQPEETLKETLVIGSDQVAELSGQLLSKPLTEANAFKQLKAASGQCVRFSTSLCVINTNKIAALSTVPTLGSTVDNSAVDLSEFLAALDNYSTPETSAGLQETLVEDEVHFRQLEDEEIYRYIAAEQPLDCAGSFKAEGLGISLFKTMNSTDPTSLIGLPLIALTGFLKQQGVSIP